MTLREKLGQLFMVGFLGSSVSTELAAFIREYKPGGVIVFSRNLESVGQMVELTNALQKLSPHSPLLISIDQEGGRVSRVPKDFTTFPPSQVVGQCNSYELAYAAASVTAAELRIRRDQHEHGSRVGREQQPVQPHHRRSCVRDDSRPRL